LVLAAFCSFLFLPLTRGPFRHDAQAAAETNGAKLAMEFGPIATALSPEFVEHALEGPQGALSGSEHILAFAAHDAPNGSSAKSSPSADLLQRNARGCKPLYRRVLGIAPFGPVELPAFDTG
jgi:hypothetical protein